MSEANESLTRLDERIRQMQDALDDSNWDLLAELNRNIRDFIDPVMSALDTQQLAVADVRQRLETIKVFSESAERKAREARDQARAAFDQVGQTRKAASAYAKVSTRGR